MMGGAALTIVTLTAVVVVAILACAAAFLVRLTTALEVEAIVPAAATVTTVTVIPSSARGADERGLKPNINYPLSGAVGILADASEPV